MAVSASSSSVAVESSSHSHTLSTPSAAPSAADSAIHSASMGSVVLPDHVAPGGGSGSGSGGRGGRDRWGNGGSGGGGSPSGRNPIAALAAGVGGYFASRAKADPDFWFKILAECGNDAVIIVAVNATARGKRFLQEIEFVLCHLTVSLLCDVALVSMLAPTVARAAPTSALGRLLDGLPANIFEPGSLVAKAGCLLYKGALYAVTGASMGYIGTQIVSLLTDAKEAMDPSYEPPAMVQDATIAAVGWLFFMGISSNIRCGSAWPPLSRGPESAAVTAEVVVSLSWGACSRSI